MPIIVLVLELVLVLGLIRAKSASQLEDWRSSEAPLSVLKKDRGRGRVRGRGRLWGLGNPNLSVPQKGQLRLRRRKKHAKAGAFAYFPNEGTPKNYA